MKTRNGGSLDHHARYSGRPGLTIQRGPRQDLARTGLEDAAVETYCVRRSLAPSYAVGWVWRLATNWAGF